MSRTFVRLVLACALVLSVGCGTMRVHALPIGISGASSTFAPLKYAAEQAGYQAWVGENGTHVTVDDASSIHFVTFSKSFNMQVIVDEKKVPADQLDAKLAAVKAIGDGLWKKAMEARRETGTIIIGG